MSWLTLAILSYLSSAAIALLDKYLLRDFVSNAKVYAFYVGLLWSTAVLLIPFVGLYYPGFWPLVLSLSAGGVFILGLYWLYRSLSLFEASRVVPVIGSLSPLFASLLIYLISFGREVLTSRWLIAFIFLILGSFLISLERKKLINFPSLKLSIAAAFFLSISFVLTKYAYLEQSFWNAFIWRGLGGVLMAGCFFLIFPEIRKDIRQKQESRPKKMIGLFVANQTVGVVGAILQNLAIFLAPLSLVSVVSALVGVQYAFLFIFSAFLSWRFPQILKEEFSRGVVLQKIIAILLLAVGLAILTL